MSVKTLIARPAAALLALGLLAPAPALAGPAEGFFGGVAGGLIGAAIAGAAAANQPPRYIVVRERRGEPRAARRAAPRRQAVARQQRPRGDAINVSADPFASKAPAPIPVSARP